MLEKLKENAVFKAVCALLLFESLSFLIVRVLECLGFVPADNLSWFIYEVLRVGLPAVGLAVLFKTFTVLRSPLKGLGRSLICGLWFFLFCGFGIFSHLADIADYKSAPQIVCFVLFVLSVGFSEELLHRGIITEVLIRKYGDSTKGKLFSIFFGSFIFSIFHLGNLLCGQSLENTLIQMLSVFFCAIFLNTIYIKYRNVYALILIHAYLDFVSLFDFGMSSGLTISDNFTSGSKSSLRNVIGCCILYLIASVVIFAVTNRKGGKKDV